jgi:hypothetical protein
VYPSLPSQAVIFGQKPAKMNENQQKHTEKRLNSSIFELRGWKAICAFIGVKQRQTAKKILKKRKLLTYEGRTPVLNKEVYRFISASRHKKALEEV